MKFLDLIFRPWGNQRLDASVIAFRQRDIITDGKLYLRRYYLFRCKWFAVYLHKFFIGDQDRHLHDHPWNFGSVILKGSYLEELPCSPHTLDTYLITRGRFSLGLRSAHQLHRVHLTDPVWTLFFHGQKQRKWGFLTEDGWVSHNQYKGTGVYST